MAIGRNPVASGATDAQRLRGRLEEWIEETGDRGRMPESEEKLREVRERYVKQVAERFEEYGIEGADGLYGYWLETLKKTGRE